jgi:putative ATPase
VTAPLPERSRPSRLDDVVGQQRWIAPGAPLYACFESGTFHSIVLWGPPGCGKTTLARLMASASDAQFIALSAVLSGVKDLRLAIDRAQSVRQTHNRSTVLFVDEIHRWNKSQQDALLPHLESGLLTLVGATTENPSFSLNSALQSRVQVIRLEPLSTADVLELLTRALSNDERLHSRAARVDPLALTRIAESSAGDARRALSDLERAITGLGPDEALDVDALARILSRDDVRHDRSGDDHYDVVSAFIKSMRGSDPDASVYWLARMLAGGEDPRFIARRLVIFASEDIGNADPRALSVATAAFDAMERIGLPEGRIVLGQAVTWLACCPKSNAAYLAINKALALVKQTGALPVPNHLRNAPTQAMKDEGFGVEYQYPHDHPHSIVDQQYLPDALVGQRLYEPVNHAEERRIVERLEWWRRKLDER